MACTSKRGGVREQGEGVLSHLLFTDRSVLLPRHVLSETVAVRDVSAVVLSRLLLPEADAFGLLPTLLLPRQLLLQAVSRFVLRASGELYLRATGSRPLPTALCEQDAVL